MSKVNFNLKKEVLITPEIIKNDTIFLSLNTNENISYTSINEKINEINTSYDKGRVVSVFDSNNNLICLFLNFYEYSDWRNSVFWWIYDCLINSDFKETFDSHSKYLINSLVKLNYQNKSCGIRFLANNNTQSIFSQSLLNISHYVVFEKNFA
jgi:hypothetical protein